MSTSRRLNIPLSVLIALSVACGLSGVGGVVGLAVDPSASAEPAAASVQDPGCEAVAMVSPRVRAQAAPPCEQTELSTRFGKARVR